MARTLSMAEARNKLTQLPDEFAQDAETGAVTVTRHGRPVLAIMPYELYDSIVETLEVMSDPELVSALRQSIREAAQGEMIPWEKAKKRLMT
ncbi:MAG TPA: type II toxin-antitoxin system Phd/YefM family antitoxin [Abditibacteriaceae bacterium]|jgi:prevent-host-death family protein